MLMDLESYEINLTFQFVGISFNIYVISYFSVFLYFLDFLIYFWLLFFKILLYAYANLN